MNPDVVNGLFEAIGAFFTWMNAWKLHKDKEVKGVYWPVTAFFASWGIWNLYYYPALGQWFSFYGGCILVIGNLLWVVQAIHFTRRQKLMKRLGGPAIEFKGPAVPRKIRASFDIGKECLLPPLGWYCTRERGHEGPCAALPRPR